MLHLNKTIISLNNFWRLLISLITIYYKLNIGDTNEIKRMCHLLIYMEVSFVLGIIGGILVVIGSSMGAIDKITKGK